MTKNNATRTELLDKRPTRVGAMATFIDLWRAVLTRLTAIVQSLAV